MYVHGGITRLFLQYDYIVRRLTRLNYTVKPIPSVNSEEKPEIVKFEPEKETQPKVGLPTYCDDLFEEKRFHCNFLVLDNLERRF